MMTHRVSSNITLFLKLFIPTGWGVFFTLFTASLFLVDEVSLPFLTAPIFKYPFLTAYLLFFFLIYKTLMQLKRVELGDDFYIVSNYFKTYRFLYKDIKAINIINLGRLQLVTFTLMAPGSFGKRIHFVASKSLWNLCLAENPSIQEAIHARVTN